MAADASRFFVAVFVSSISRGHPKRRIQQHHKDIEYRRKVRIFNIRKVQDFYWIDIKILIHMYLTDTHNIVDYN
jgi:hypothetical protein